MSNSTFYRGAFIDLDGTLYNGNHVIDYAVTMIERFREANVPFLLLTNNSTRTPQMVANHLLELGILVSAAEVFNSAIASAMYVLANRPFKDRKPNVYCIGEKGLRTALGEAGIHVMDWSDNLGNIDFVVQGMDRELTFDLLKNAVHCILNGAKFVLTNPDLLLPWNHQLVPGAGAIGAAIEAATSAKPIIIGKPSSIIMNYALERINQVHRVKQPLMFKDVWTIGDNLRTDVAAGKQVGSTACLVLTGLTTQENQAQLIADTGVQPDRVFVDLKALTDAFLLGE
jgi:4-nitrophenyl phosphatase